MPSVRRECRTVAKRSVLFKESDRAGIRPKLTVVAFHRSDDRVNHFRPAGLSQDAITSVDQNKVGRIRQWMYPDLDMRLQSSVVSQPVKTTRRSGCYVEEYSHVILQPTDGIIILTHVRRH